MAIALIFEATKETVWSTILVFISVLSEFDETEIQTYLDGRASYKAFPWSKVLSHVKVINLHKVLWIHQ